MQKFPAYRTVLLGNRDDSPEVLTSVSKSYTIELDDLHPLALIFRHLGEREDERDSLQG